MKRFKVCALALMFLLCQSPVFAEIFDIPPGPLEQTLTAYADVTGQNLVYMNSLVAGKTSSGVQGDFSPKQALNKVLAGTGLTFTLSAQGDMVLKKVPAPSSSVPQRQRQKETAFVAHSGLMAMEEMVVTATKTPIKTKEVAASIGIITSEEIKLTAQTDNFYDAIRNIPGVNITYEGTRPATYLRGEMPSVLINGKEMNQFAGFYHLYGGLIGMGAVDRIEVLKGPQSAIHGSKAISGVINVDLKSGDKDSPYIETAGIVGHGDQIQGNLSISGGHKDFSYFLNIEAGEQPDWETSDGTIPFTNSTQKNFYSFLEYELNDSHSISLEYLNSDGTEISGGKGTYYQQLNPWRLIYDQDYKLHYAFLNYNGKLTDWFSLYASVGAGENDYKVLMGSNGTMDPNGRPEGNTLNEYLNGKTYSNSLENFISGEIRGTFDILSENRLKIITGAQYKDTELDSKWVAFNTVAFDAKKDETYIAPYIQAEYRPFVHALLMAGIRHDSYDSGNKDSKKTSPRIGLSIFPFAHTNRNWTTLWASYSEAFKAPQADQLYNYLSGNPDLDPEEAKGWEGGFKQRIGNWANMEFTYFDTEYKNQIIYIWDNSTFTGRYENLGQSKTKGYEALLEVYPTSWLRLYLGYTNLDMEDQKTKKDIPLQPKKTYNYGLTIEDMKGFYFSVWGNQKNDWVINENGMKHPNNGDVIWNAKILYKWNIANNIIFEPFISVENLTDKKVYGQPKFHSLFIQEERALHIGGSLRVNF